MENARLKRNFKKIENYIHNQSVKDALDLLKELVIKSGKGELVSQYESLDDTYENLLKYTIEGVNDPERESIYTHLQLSILELADVAYQHTRGNSQEQSIHQLKKRIETQSKQIKEEAIQSIEDLAFNEELSDILVSSSMGEVDSKKNYLEHQETLTDIFNLIWLTDKFKDADVKLVYAIMKARNFPWYERSIIISALMISAIRCFDVHKLELLVDFSKDENDQIRQRALTGLFLTLHIYDSRLHYYPELIGKIKGLKSLPDIEKHIELIAIQFLKSNETEKVTQKLENEIMPEVAKFQPKLRDKLDLDNIMSKDVFEDKNPDWERVFEDAPDLMDKLEEISKMQMEGVDVFMSAFSRLKYFEFFNEMTNWFRPFHTDNYPMIEAMKNEKENFDSHSFLDGLSHSFFMCNSDKFSFCLNLQQMPAMQKNLMIEMFNAELEGIKEIQKEDGVLNKSSQLKSIYSQYIHDLYRFYKLHPLKNEFLDVFTIKFDFYKSSFFKLLVTDDNIIRNIAEFFFENNYFERALEIYLMLNEKGDNSMEIFEKIAFCYQKLKNYEQALEFYRKAELYEANRAWNLKKLALCNRFLKNYKVSLSYYLEALKLEPENLYIQTYIGHSYLDMKEYEDALSYYFKVEMLDQENEKVFRPIAWCSFILGKLDTAKTYYLRLMERQANKYDYMNLGHVEWCLGNRKAALKNYKLSVTREDNNMKLFLAGFEEDKSILIKHGIDTKEIPLMLDYLKYML
jgi:tetratricopeptide (TPR) repeat protein